MVWASQQLASLLFTSDKKRLHHKYVLERLRTGFFFKEQGFDMLGLILLKFL